GSGRRRRRGRGGRRLRRTGSRRRGLLGSLLPAFVQRTVHVGDVRREIGGLRTLRQPSGQLERRECVAPGLVLRRRGAVTDEKRQSLCLVGYGQKRVSHVHLIARRRRIGASSANQGLAV